MSGGAIAGIVIGVIAAIIVAVIIVVKCKNRERAPNNHPGVPAVAAPSPVPSNAPTPADPLRARGLQPTAPPPPPHNPAYSDDE